MANITGHGWRKIMRHPEEFSYRITSMPPVPEVLSFMVENGEIQTEEAYGSLNMGAGYAIYISEPDVKKVLSISEELGIRAYEAGVVEKGNKQVVIDPLEISYKGSSLKLRG